MTTINEKWLHESCQLVELQHRSLAMFLPAVWMFGLCRARCWRCREAEPEAASDVRLPQIPLLCGAPGPC